MKVTKEEFQAYERVRAGGLSNMSDVKFVEYASGLDRKTIFKIIRTYDELSKLYGEANK